MLFFGAEEERYAVKEALCDAAAAGSAAALLLLLGSGASGIAAMGC